MEETGPEHSIPFVNCQLTPTCPPAHVSFKSVRKKKLESKAKTHVCFWCRSLTLGSNTSVRKIQMLLKQSQHLGLRPSLDP